MSITTILKSSALALLILSAATHAQEARKEKIDVSRWALREYNEDFFRDRALQGAAALEYWMQASDYRGNAGKSSPKRTQFERLWSDKPQEVAAANAEISRECRAALADMPAFRKKGHRSAHLWVVLALRARERLTPETYQTIQRALKELDLTHPDSGYISWLEIQGSNGSNVHGHLTPLSLGPEIIDDRKARDAAYWGFRRELDHMNTTGDVAEFNLLESHWNGVADWEPIKLYSSDPHMRRMARMITERLWINRFLTWSPAVERNTGPGSRMAPSEWLGCDNERMLFATGVEKPIWLNPFFDWKVWNGRSIRGAWPLTQSEAMLPVLPSYLQDLAWRKSYPNEVHAAVTQSHWANYPKLKGVTEGDVMRPMKYVNYQTENYTIGSSTSSWVVNTCYVGMAAFWNNSRNPKAPLGSPERFSVLYPHYVVNGMSFLDKGEIYFENSPAAPLADSKGGPGGPYMREFIEFGRMGILQDRGTMAISYTTKPGTHHSNFVKDKVKRASAGMFLYRWTEGLEGLWVNREPVQSLPRELNPGDWWFIEDGDVYVAIRPLAQTCLKGPCKTVLEKRTRHIVLYQDNFVGDSIAGISDEDWVKARSGFIVEMGNKSEYGSFDRFRTRILKGEVAADDLQGFARHVAYNREDRRLDMRWNSYTEEYAGRKINGRDDPWTKYLQSPEFAVNDGGTVTVKDATLRTAAGKSAWLLSSPAAKAWVAYQANDAQELPFEMKCPAGILRADRMPFGKAVLRKASNDSVALEIDASYRPFFGNTKIAGQLQRTSGLPSELIVDCETCRLTVAINGLSYQPRRESRNGRPVWVVNPYDKPVELRGTVLRQ